MGEIYKITNKINGKVYIGQTIRTAEQRLKEHLYSSNNRHLSNALRKYGIENFILEVLESNVEEKDLDALEIKYIAQYNSQVTGYNETSGGCGTRGYVFTQQDREKMRNSMKKAWEQPNSNLRDPARGAKISQALKGQTKSLEHRKKLSVTASQRIGDKNPFYGKHHSTESNKKISDANSKTVYMYDLNMSFIKEFKNGKIAAKYLKKRLSLNFKEESVYRGINWACIKNKSYKNFYFKYYKV